MRLVPVVLVALASSVVASPALVAEDGPGNSAVIAGFLPPVAVATSGSSVTYTALDMQHTFTEGGLLVQLSGPACVNAALDPGGPAGGATFTIDGGQLVTGQGATRKVCTSATVNGPVAVMRFFCAVHPAAMNGVLVVVG